MALVRGAVAALVVVVAVLRWFQRPVAVTKESCSTTQRRRR
jgi:hypothetical protein